MKIMSIRDVRAGLAEAVEQAQKEPICLTKHGKAVAVLAGLDGADLDSFVLESSQAFWDEIQKRRKSTKPRKRIEEIRKRG